MTGKRAKWQRIRDRGPIPYLIRFVALYLVIVLPVHFVLDEGFLLLKKGSWETFSNTLTSYHWTKQLFSSALAGLAVGFFFWYNIVKNTLAPKNITND